MLQYIGHRLSCDGVSFAIPDGFYLDGETDEGVESGLSLLSPDHTYRLDIGIEHFVHSAPKELANVLGETGFQVLVDIQSVTVNGLLGYYAAYSSKLRQYYEVRFDLREDPNGTVSLVILISTDQSLIPVQKPMSVVHSIDPRPVLQPFS